MGGAKTIPSSHLWKKVFHETSPWCQKSWGPRIKPLSAALLGRFFTTVPPGKSKTSKYSSLFFTECEVAFHHYTSRKSCYFHFGIPLQGGTLIQLYHLQDRQITMLLGSPDCGWSPGQQWGWEEGQKWALEISRVVRGVWNVTCTNRDHIPVLEKMCCNDQRNRIESSEINICFLLWISYMMKLTFLISRELWIDYLVKNIELTGEPFG